MVKQTDATKIPLKVLPKSGKELGQSGTYIWNGIITGEEYNFDLTGTRGLNVLDVMRKSDSSIHAVLLVCKNPIVAASWDLEQFSDDPRDEEIKNFVKQELFNRKITFPDFIREGSNFLDFGHSVFEIVYELTDFEGAPRIGLSKLASRKQRSITAWETPDHQPGITQILNKGNDSGVGIPREKLVYFTNEREGENWDGISLLRFAYKPWKIKDALDIMLAVSLERKAVGVPVIKKGVNNQTVGEPELEAARTALRQLYANEESFLEIPDGIDISMLDLSMVNTDNVLDTIQYENEQITLSVLAQFLLLGSGKNASGSRATSQDHSALFSKALEAVARTIQQTIQQDIINRLVDLNYTDVKGYPKLVFSDISDDDITSVSTAFANLANAGAIRPDADTENRLRKLLGMPPLGQDAYDNYEENTPEPITDNGNNEDGDPPKNDKKPVKKATKDLSKAGKDKADASRAIAAARSAQTGLIDVILRV